MTALAQAATQRIWTIKATSEVQRDAFSQHLTPPETAALAASFFSETHESIGCLDLGAGMGMLSVALIERFGGRINKIDAIEADAALSSIDSWLFSVLKSPGVSASNSPSRMPVQYNTSNAANDRGLSITASAFILGPILHFCTTLIACFSSFSHRIVT